MYMMISNVLGWLAGWPAIVHMWQNFNIAIFSDTVNMINVKLCMTVVLTELYQFISLLET